MTINLNLEHKVSSTGLKSKWPKSQMQTATAIELKSYIWF